jgi:hypothetical protein
MRLFEEFRRENHPNDQRPLQDIPPSDLDRILSHFFMTYFNPGE